MDEDALTVICYRKWTKETLSGQIYAVPKELEASENDSIADTVLQQVNAVEIITLLKNIKREIMYGIFLICILLFLILIRIH
jgi:DNA-binding FrmR family transcriptional regulator